MKQEKLRLGKQYRIVFKNPKTGMDVLDASKQRPPFVSGGFPEIMAAYFRMNPNAPTSTSTQAVEDWYAARWWFFEEIVTKKPRAQEVLLEQE